MTLAEFLLARITEDEAAARQSNPHRIDYGNDWETEQEACDRWDRQPHGRKCGWHLGEGMADECECAYPARVLAECEAKRRIVSTMRSALDGAWQSPARVEIEFIANRTLQSLALPYADHPDYDEAWRP